MQKIILCTLDFSQSSGHTLRCAVTLARDLGAHLTVLYTYRLIKDKHDELFEQKKKIEEKAAMDFVALEKEVLTGQGITYDFRTEVGFVADRVDAYARNSSLGYVVIDKKMSIDSRESFDELLETMSVPTLIVP